MSVFYQGRETETTVANSLIYRECKRSLRDGTSQRISFVPKVLQSNKKQPMLWLFLSGAGNGDYSRELSDLSRVQTQVCVLETAHRISLKPTILLKAKKKSPVGCFQWSGKRDSNSRRLPWQGNALPLSHSRIFGGNYRARTCDLLLVRQMLSQLS